MDPINSFHVGDRKTICETWGFVNYPFDIPNATNFPNHELVQLFTFETQQLSKVLESGNKIIVGSRGSGKTMLLRALEAYHKAVFLYNLCVHGKAEVFPVYINGSKLYFNKDEEVSTCFVRWVIRTLLETCKMFQNSLLRNENWFEEMLVNPICKFKYLIEDKPVDDLRDNLLSNKEMFSKKLAVGDILHDFMKEIKILIDQEDHLYKNPDLFTFANIFSSTIGKKSNRLLLLFDEINALDKPAFQIESNNMTTFEVFINKLRNENYLYSIIAIEPNDKVDFVRKTRYGEEVLLTEDFTNYDGMKRRRKYFYKLLRSYFAFSKGVNRHDFSLEDCFLLLDDNYWEGNQKGLTDENSYDSIEQLILGSYGLPRLALKFIKGALLQVAERYQSGAIHILSIDSTDIRSQITKYGEKLLNANSEVVFGLVSRCRAEKTYKFFCNKELVKPLLGNDESIVFTVKNPHKKNQLIYEFNLAYALYADLPTHKMIDDENNLSESRSVFVSEWITHICRIDQNLIYRKEKALELKEKLIKCKSGIKYFSQYEDVCSQIIEYLFIPPLKSYKKQHFNFFKNKRRDYILYNPSEGHSFWRRIYDKHGSELVILDAKNGAKGVTIADLNSVYAYLNPTVGKLGIIFCRVFPKDGNDKGKKKTNLSSKSIKAHLVDNYYNNQNKVLLIIPDEVVIEMLDLRAEDKDPAEVLERILIEFKSLL